MEQTHELSGDTLASKVSKGVWEVLQVAMGSDSAIVKKNVMKDLTVDEDALRRNSTNRHELTNELFRITQRAYNDIPFKKLEECADKLCDKVVAVLKEDPPAEVEGASSAVGEEPSAAAAGGDDDDQSMEQKTATLTPVVKSQSLVQKVSEAVWKAIKHLLPSDTTCAELNVDEEKLLSLDKNGLMVLLYDKVPEAYRDAYKNVSDVYYLYGKVLRELKSKVSDVMKVIKAHKETPFDAEKAHALADAFRAPYYGTADDEFEKHLKRCCDKYLDNSAVYTAPYVAITQSSGFGKSRLLYRLAQKLDEREENKNMRLLYICGRDIPGSTGFPIATPDLFDFIFPDEINEKEIARRLRRAFDYACANWESVQREWNGVFSASDKTVSKAVASNLNKCDFTLAQSAAYTCTTNPFLVVVIDEARSLLSKTDEHGVVYFRLLRRALTQANATLREEKKTKPLIFAVLVDTNSQIHDFTPPRYNDPSSRLGEPQTRLFPPFVLTHTMDVLLKNLKSTTSVPLSYKKCVLETNSDAIREVLLAMGRPLWHTQYTKVAVKERLHNVLFLGGTKLLCGLEPVAEKSYSDDTLHGVAALMCRLGLRPQARTAFASQVVANFMAVLHAVNYTYDGHISGYVSEPFLAFAATHMWYERYPTTLTMHMLPQFQELMMQGVIDVGSIGEVVARMFLLLAMDSAIMKSVKGDAAEFSLNSGKHRFEGQFCSVPELLAVLDGTTGDRETSEYDLRQVTIESKKGSDPATSGTTETTTKKRKVAAATSQARDPSTQQVSVPKNSTKLKKATTKQTADFQLWMNGWDEWSVSFSHFVELARTPTKETLWCMLGRRAAGMFPRGHKGADLIIPIFRRNPNDVSCILVRVEDVNGKDIEFPHSALTHMMPSKVFKKQNASNQQKVSDLLLFNSTNIIRVFIALGQSNLHGAQLYFIDRTDNGDDGAYTLCLRGMCKEPRSENPEPHTYWPFLGDGIWKDLMKLARAAWWDPMEVIKAGLKNRKTHAKAVADELPDVEVEDTAKHTLEIMVYDAAKAGKEKNADEDMDDFKGDMGDSEEEMEDFEEEMNADDEMKVGPDAEAEW